MEFLTWEKDDKKLTKIFDQLHKTKEFIYLWQSWGSEASERVMQSCQLHQLEEDSKRMVFSSKTTEDKAQDVKYSQFSENDEIYCFASQSDIIFKSKILAISSENGEILLDKANKLIWLVINNSKEKTAQEKALEEHIMGMILGIQDGLKQIGFKKENIKNSAKNYAFSPPAVKENTSNWMLKLEGLLDGSNLNTAIFENVKDISMMIKGYGPIDFKVYSLQALQLVLETDLKNLCNPSDPIEILSMDNILLKKSMKGIVTRVEEKKGFSGKSARKEFRVLIQLKI